MNVSFYPKLPRQREYGQHLLLLLACLVTFALAFVSEVACVSWKPCVASVSSDGTVQKVARNSHTEKNLFRPGLKPASSEAGKNIF
ncbi:hypothetical protein DXV75_07300 [Alteromonas aestuariivivens]|uniref:Uncharacterized protein n=1 Tax=Alteromonas aestuariivivens TaxID=1938339 RepID=A0A3D8M9X7_9ALTE|nr:hypothetical protein DXV75_07300 [Alteromonas aestuariivivens]